MLTKLLSPSPPNLHLAAFSLGELDALRDHIERSHPQAFVRILRGRRSRTAATFFDEAAAALQFPSHFGHNWNAFADCLDDLCLSGGPRVLLISLAGELFADETSALTTLATAITQLHAPDRPLHVVLHETPGGVPGLEARLGAAALAFEPLPT